MHDSTVVTASTPTPTPANVYTTAARRAHEAHCTPCRETTEADTARYAANAASMARCDRLTLGLRATRPAVTQ